jgi:hypothetical protein
VSSPGSPPPNVPIPSGPKPSLRGSSNLERNAKTPIFLTSDHENVALQADPQTASMDDLRELFEKCCVGRVADLRSAQIDKLSSSPRFTSLLCCSLFIRELRAAFGSSSAELRNQLIDQTSSGNSLSLPRLTSHAGTNSQKISWKQFTVRSSGLSLYLTSSP